ncbi:hypothetical protein [Microbacterium sp. Gd 4-13]|uniref:hypothetical protein n=1 Tax=Microbacterium sp. Gd 4-13 TaxID=2173179 RepID=UPI001401D1AB|nr:hypothetical protein [Microbacterium sp. Gd 4-13]
MTEASHRARFAGSVRKAKTSPRSRPMSMCSVMVNMRPSRDLSLAEIDTGGVTASQAGPASARGGYRRSS